MLESLVLEFLEGMKMRVITFWFRCDNLIEKLALPMLLAGFGIGLGHSDGLSHRPTSLCSDHNHSCGWRRFKDQSPFVLSEVRFRGHVSPIQLRRLLSSFSQEDKTWKPTEWEVCLSDPANWRHSRVAIPMCQFGLTHPYLSA